MDAAAFIKEVGGGLAGVVIVVQGWFNWIQYQRNSALQDKMLLRAWHKVYTPPRDAQN